MLLPFPVLSFGLIFIFKICESQKPNTDTRRHDVYIAGFFPYGRGVENSETGEYFRFLPLVW